MTTNTTTNSIQAIAQLKAYFAAQQQAVTAMHQQIADQLSRGVTFSHEERLMHDTTLFVFKGRPSGEDQKAIIEFADFHGMAVVLDGRAVTLITDQPRIATLFKLTFGGNA